MILNDAIDEIIDNVKTASDELDIERVKEMLKLLTSCNNVFLLGLGRFWFSSPCICYETHAFGNRSLCSW